MIKRPIDIQRESAGRFRIEANDDCTPIGEMFELNDRLLILTKKAAYEVTLADQIDPKRENPNIPKNVQRRILEFGTDSELVGRTLLTAKSLFHGKFLSDSINAKQAMTFSFEALTDLVAMHTTATEYEIAEKKEIQAAGRRPAQKASLAIPSVPDVTTRCKTFFQKADHVEQTTWDIVRLFYPSIQTKCNFGSLHNFLKDEYGVDDDFTKFIEQALPFLRMIRNARDCLDHRNAKGAVVTNFALSAGGKISRPTIEINFRDTHQLPVDISLLMPKAVESMLNVFDTLIAYLCSKSGQAFGGVFVGTIPENRRHNKHIRYSFGMVMNGEFCPIG